MFLLINKPPDITSHDVVNKLRQITGVKKIGHAGTLDPLATGLLILAIKRESTKHLQNFIKLDKQYIAKLQFGSITDTYDKQGTITKIINKNKIHLGLLQIKNTITNFIGTQYQTPPAHSAKKIKGKKAYQLARQGITPKLKKQSIRIHNIQILNYDNKNQQLELKINCSSGTYMRSLAHDIGQQLGTGAYLEELIRTRIGQFDLKNAVSLSRLTSDNWQKYTFNNYH